MVDLNWPASPLTCHARDSKLYFSSMCARYNSSSAAANSVPSRRFGRFLMIRILSVFFHHEHFDGFVAGRQFESKLIQQGFLKSIGILSLRVFVPFEFNIETAR